MRLRKQIQIAGLLLLMSLACLVAIWQRQKREVAVESASGGGKISDEESLPSCWDPMPPPSGETGQHHPQPHSVTLSWKASIPVSKTGQNAVKGYYIYRSRTSQEHTLAERMNAQPIRGTVCVDRAVKPDTTYFYSIRAISQGGAQSVFSHEVRAVVPSR